MNLPLRDDPDYSAFIPTDYMLDDEFLNSRLDVRIRRKEGVSYGVGSQFRANPFDKTGMLITYAIYNPENAERLEKAFREETE